MLRKLRNSSRHQTIANTKRPKDTVFSLHTSKHTVKHSSAFGLICAVHVSSAQTQRVMKIYNLMFFSDISNEWEYVGTYATRKSAIEILNYMNEKTGNKHLIQVMKRVSNFYFEAEKINPDND